MRYNEVKGDLIELAKAGTFDVVAHGCNCFCVMGRGVAPQMATAFGCNRFRMEDKSTAGDINKLGQIDYDWVHLDSGKGLYVVNVYSQYTPNVALKPLDYEALTLGLRKINHTFEGKHIGLPYVIGAGLAGGDKYRIIEIIKRELHNCDVTLVKLPE